MRAWKLLLGLVGVLAAGSSGARVEVPTRNGVVAGEADEVHQTFLGIPYGQAPVGNYRFASPRPALSWSPAVFNATEQPKACPGTFQSLFELLPAFEVDEDCLTLSIYTPNRERMSKPLPVMFWIYGGAYILGDGYEFGMYDGSYLVSTRDVIIVTHNYRLGPFGYLVAEGGAEGNYGIEDQRLALQWVIDNIANFGGDPNQITLFGESAGAMSVGIHMISPLSKGMFQRAIMQSNAMGLQFKSREQALKVSKRLAKVLDCPEGNELECLRAADWRNVAYKRLPIFFAGMEDLVGDILAWGPTIDNNNMMMQPIEAFNAGAFHDVPTIWGTNKDEMALFRGLIENALDLLGLVTGRNGTVEIGPLVYNVLINLMFKEKADMILDKYPPSFRQDNFPLLEEVLTEYVFHCSSRNAALGNARTSTSPVYTYEFVHVAEWAPMLGRLNRLCFSTSSCHAMELPYVFHTERVTLVPVSPRFTEREEYMSQKMMDYWTAFAAGNVNGKNPPVEWSVFSPSKQIALEISPEFSTKNWDTATCDFWDEVGYTF